jgi:hypothetical protein
VPRVKEREGISPLSLDYLTARIDYLVAVNFCRKFSCFVFGLESLRPYSAIFVLEVCLVEVGVGFEKYCKHFFLSFCGWWVVRSLTVSLL